MFFFYLQSPQEQEAAEVMAKKSALAKYKLRQKAAKVDPALEEQFQAGRVMGKSYDEVIYFCFSSLVFFKFSLFFNDEIFPNFNGMKHR